MKPVHQITRLLVFPLLGFIILGTSSCIQDSCDGLRTFTEYEPVWMLPEEVKAVQLEDPRALETPGKIYSYLDLLFINQPYEGVHIFDNTDPTAPVPLKFLSIPGNVDIAIRGDMLYADNGPDLVTFNLNEPANPQFVGRVEGVFSHFFPVSGEQGILLFYRESTRTIEVECDDPRWNDDVLFFDNGILRAESSAMPNAIPAQATGTGGSLARFTILDSWLYTVDEVSLRAFSLDDPAQPSLENTVQIGWGIETIFPFRDFLFLGANNGMFIFDATDRSQPFQRSVFRHAQACDPVFVQDNRAYVTLRDGTTCQNFINQLDVVDITDLDDPTLLASYSMHHPIGLSVVEDWLYLCDDDAGLKVFDKSPHTRIAEGPELVLSGLSAIDIIALPQKDLAIVIGTDGLHQYDISERENPAFLSLIPVVENP